MDIIIHLESWMGMPWTLAVTIIATTLLVSDIIFVSGDLLTYAADILYTVVLVHFIPTNNLLWLSLCTIVIYISVLLTHLLLWRQILGKTFNRCIAPDKEKSLNERLIGRRGDVSKDRDQLFIHIDDEFLLCLPNDEDRIPEVFPFKAKISGWDSASEVFRITPEK